jgi:hypothetical protein
VKATSTEQLSADLKATRDALDKAERLVSVAHGVAEAILEAATPLEVLTYLHYLTKNSADDPRKVVEYMDEAETQALRLLEIHRRIIRTHGETIEAVSKSMAS